MTIDTTRRRSLHRPGVLLLLGSWIGMVIGGCIGGPAPRPTESADVIFHGRILTLVSDESEAEALAIRGERIVAVGAKRDVDAYRGEATQQIELGDAVLLPGFIDAHGHLTALASFIQFANLASPPVGPVTDIGDLQTALRAHAGESQDWIIGRGYDESLLAEGRHPTRDDLDVVSRDRPVFIAHVSLHLGVANSKALELAGISASTPDPRGGVIRRRAGSLEPDGVLEESALYEVMARLPPPSPEQALADLVAAGREYAANGFTTVQDGATSMQAWQLLRAADRAGLLRQDVLAYAVWHDAELWADEARDESQHLDRVKLGGIKLVLDGSPQGKTAYLTAPYHVPPRGQGASYRGYPALPDEEVVAEVEKFARAGYQVMIHANGDAAIDQMIAAIDALEEKHPQPDRRPILIHGQVTRPDQIGELARLGIVPSFFSAHTFFWGDWHRDSVLGPGRAPGISPTASARAARLRFTVHMDAPVLPPDAMRMIWATVNRQTRSARTLGVAERIPVMAAIAATTRDAAYQHFEESRKGTLEVGKLADLVILERDPRLDPVSAIAEIAIRETWSHGERIHPRDTR